MRKNRTIVFGREAAYLFVTRSLRVTEEGAVDGFFEKRVFLVDDESLGLEALSRTLRSLGYEAVGVSSLAEARRALSKWTERPCAFALVDNRLGDGFGVDLLTDLSKLNPAPAVALISGLLTSAVATQAFKRGAIPMARPSDPDTLRELLDLLGHLRTRSRGASGSSSAPRGSDPSIDVLSPPVAFGPFSLLGHCLSTPSGPRKLRHAESKLLRVLADHRPGAVGMAELARIVLGRDDEGSRRSVYSHVTNLRLSLGPYAGLVETDRKRGYRLALEPFNAA